MLLLILLAASIVAEAAQYTAYSLKVAQQRIEQAGENWRQKEPEAVNLAGINKVEGFVFDIATGDLILVGQKDQGRAVLTLDDVVVALRARFRYKEWPLVSIDPSPETEKTEVQHIRFEGGIDETSFGQTMYEADYRLKEIGMGLQAAGLAGMQTYWDRSVEEMDRGIGVAERNINSRFWFYPINPQVVVREGVCVVRGLKVGVFTEVMGAKIDGRPVEDLNGFKDQTGDAFANDVSERFEQLCGVQPSFNRLRGLQELVAVSKALEEMEQRPDLSYWLEKYQLVKAARPADPKVLHRRHNGQRFWLEVSGGVHLTALAMRLNAGDVTALREAVLKVRPASDTLGWGFITAGEWIVSDVDFSKMDMSSAAALFSHGEFLFHQGDYDRAIAYWLQITRAYPEMSEVYMKIGMAFERKGLRACAAEYYTKGLEANRAFREGNLK